MRHYHITLRNGLSVHDVCPGQSAWTARLVTILDLITSSGSGLEALPSTPIQGPIGGRTGVLLVGSHLISRSSASEATALIEWRAKSATSGGRRQLPKLGLRDRVQAVILAYETRLVRPPEAILQAA
jgi:hypothetical protein